MRLTAIAALAVLLGCASSPGGEPSSAASASPGSGSVDAGAPLTECPAEPPESGGPCSPSLRCEYGEACCCGSCGPEIVCSCDTEWQDARLDCSGGWCADVFCGEGCARFEILTEQGCMSCADALKAADAAVSHAIAAHAACATDEDCVRAPGPHCGRACGSVGKQHLEDFRAQAEVIDDSICGQAGPCLDGWYSDKLPACPGKLSRCIDGACQPAEACDPSWQPAGTPCDDYEHCTVDDACIADRACAGTPIDCDDGDPCTDDACVGLAGCTHTPNGCAAP